MISKNRKQNRKISKTIEQARNDSLNLNLHIVINK